MPGGNRHPDDFKTLDSGSRHPGLGSGLPGMTTEFCCEFLTQDARDHNIAIHLDTHKERTEPGSPKVQTQTLFRHALTFR